MHPLKLNCILMLLLLLLSLLQMMMTMINNNNNNNNKIFRYKILFITKQSSVEGLNPNYWLYPNDCYFLSIKY